MTAAPRSMSAEELRSTIEDEQPGRAARRGFLRDQLVRKLEIEIGDVHAARSTQIYSLYRFRAVEDS